MRKKYEEPKIQFTTLCLDEAVAGICWGYAKNGKSPLLYYNLPGKGSLEFKVTDGGGGCDKGQPTEISYVIDENKNGVIEQKERYTATQDHIQILYKAMHNEMGGNSGESFQGSEFHEDDIPTTWS